MSRVLHLLAQRPLLTGSGVSLDALVRQAARAGWDQSAAVGVPIEDKSPRVGSLDAARIHPLFFGQGELDFPVPGMSDVMPYPSTRFSQMTEDQIARYKAAWVQHVKTLIEHLKPDVVYSHHVWILSSLIKELAPGLPVVVRCHATGLRQMSLCPHLAEEVRTGCARSDAFVVLHKGHAQALSEMLGVSLELIHVVGAGYRKDLFHARDRDQEAGGRLLYIGKFSAAKGLPWLLDAFERLERRRPGIELHIAGSGAGEESEALARRMRTLSPKLKMHGHLDQPALSDLMRQCSVCVLPSFYEGVPLVLVEALACGCRLVTTELPGVMDQLAPHLKSALELVALPRLDGPDTPFKEDLPCFVERLEFALEAALAEGPVGDPAVSLPGALEPFTWDSVFRREEELWKSVVRGTDR